MFFEYKHYERQFDLLSVSLIMSRGLNFTIISNMQKKILKLQILNCQFPSKIAASLLFEQYSLSHLWEANFCVFSL